MYRVADLEGSVLDKGTAVCRYGWSGLGNGDE